MTIYRGCVSYTQYEFYTYTRQDIEAHLDELDETPDHSLTVNEVEEALQNDPTGTYGDLVMGVLAKHLMPISRDIDNYEAETYSFYDTDDQISMFEDEANGQ